VPPTHRIVRGGPDQVVVEIIGEHDLASRDTIRDLFLELVETNHLLVVDVSEATFIDSSFLGVLLNANKRAEELGSSFRLQVGTAPIVHRVLEISGTIERIACAHDRAEALQ
jgi:anti-sigma B factor antagonist